MDSLENEIEALLFLTAKNMKPKEISKLLNISIEEVEDGLEKLRKRWEKREGSIYLRKVGEEYSLTVKPEYAEKLKNIIKRTELTKRELKVLGAIKKYNGILKSKLVKGMGSWVYEVVKSLKEKGFVKERKAGKSSRLVVTEKFKEYFGVE